MNLEFLQREEFTNQYGETSSHILSELFRYFPIAFGLQKDSVFTAKFGEIIRYDENVRINNLLTLKTCRKLNEGGLIGHWIVLEMDKVLFYKSSWKI